jgi:hypothetical protein
MFAGEAAGMPPNPLQQEGPGRLGPPAAKPADPQNHDCGSKLGIFSNSPPFSDDSWATMPGAVQARAS